MAPTLAAASGRPQQFGLSPHGDRLAGDGPGGLEALALRPTGLLRGAADAVSGEDKTVPCGCEVFIAGTSAARRPRNTRAVPGAELAT